MEDQKMKFSGKFASAAIFGIAAMAAADIGPFSSIGQFARTSTALTPATIGGVSPKIELEIFIPGGTSALPGPDADGVRRMGRIKIDAKVTANPPGPGTVTFTHGSRILAKAPLSAASTMRQALDLTKIENLGSAPLKTRVDYDFKDQQSGSSQEILLDVDTQGPLLSSVNLIGDPTAEVVGVRLQFDRDDLEDNTGIGTNDFIVERKLSSGTFTPIAYAREAGGALPIEFNGAAMTLPIVGPLVVGEYRVTVKDSLKDQVGNPAGQITVAKGIEPQQLPFSTGIFRPTGPAIDFPQYTQREKLDPDTNFNPGDHVETRVVRLYYNRDAHRVAQIINRDIKQWNRAGVNDARKVATQARSEADTARTRREKEEQLAINASKKVRTLERKLEAAKTKREAAQRKLEEVKRLKEAISDLGPASGTGVASDTDSLFQEIRFATINTANLGNVNVANSTVTGGTLATQDTVNGELISGSLESGSFSAGNISWTDQLGNRFSGTIIAGEIDATAGPILISRGTITGTTTGGQVVNVRRTGAVTTASSIEGSIVRNATIQNAVIQRLVTRTNNSNQEQIDRLTKQLQRETNSDDPNTADPQTLVTAASDADQDVKNVERELADQRAAVDEASLRVDSANRTEQLANGRSLKRKWHQGRRPRLVCSSRPGICRSGHAGFDQCDWRRSASASRADSRNQRNPHHDQSNRLTAWAG